MIGKDAVLHLIADDIYLDIKFLSWTAGGGGGFSYERSTVPEPSSLILLAALAGSVVMTRPRR
jgi:hypothetical protein